MRNIVIIKHPKCPQTFLFSVPESALKHIVTAFAGSEPLRTVVGMLEERPLVSAVKEAS